MHNTVLRWDDIGFEAPVKGSFWRSNKGKKVTLLHQITGQLSEGQMVASECASLQVLWRAHALHPSYCSHGTIWGRKEHTTRCPLWEAACYARKGGVQPPHDLHQVCLQLR